MSVATRKLPRVTELAHWLIKRFVSTGDTVIDATVGNGYDTLFLSDLVGTEGKVYGFDVQQTAIESARNRLGDRKNVELVHAGHEQLSTFVEDEVQAVMFNLGYLPGGDKNVKTLPDSTLKALSLGFDQLSSHGVISLVVYPGHDGGREEADAVDQWLQSLDPENANYARWIVDNSRNDFPYLVAIEKL